MVNIDNTFKADGGLGGFLGQAAYEDGTSNIDGYRVLFDNAFNFIIMMLISELLAGIIIDKFGEMRSDAERIEEDSKSFCFICGQTRDDIEKNYDNDF